MPGLKIAMTLDTFAHTSRTSSSPYFCYLTLNESSRQVLHQLYHQLMARIITPRFYPLDTGLLPSLF